MSQNLEANHFPLFRNVSFFGLKCRPGVSIRFELNCVGLPHFADPVIHFVREINGSSDDHVITFATALHPSHIPGIDGQDDDVLEKNGGPEALSLVVSPRVLRKAELRLERSASFVIVILDVKGSHDFRVTGFLDKLSRFFEPDTVKTVPTAPISKTKLSKKSADDSAEKTFRSRRRKAS